MTFFLRTVGLLLGMLSLCISIQNASAQEPSEDLERQVKSAYIFKFGNYVAWPDKTFAEASSPIVIGVVDDNLTADELEKIAKDHLTGSSPAVIKRLSSKNLSADVHILYVASDATQFINLIRMPIPNLLPFILLTL